MNISAKEFDVIVAGGGQAGLIAAIVAAEAGASVCLLEGAPRAYRGGNTRHTRNLRPMHKGPLSVLSGVYDEEEYWDDLLRVTKGKTNEPMARMMLRESAGCVDWLEQRGVQFQPPLGGTLHLGRTNAFFMGGGKQLVNALYRFAENLGISISYEAKVTDIKFEAGRFEGVFIGDEYIAGRAFVAAAGGFEANIEWLREAWGPVADNFIIRGTPYNRGVVLADLLDQGVEQVGDPTQCHAVAIDGRAPKFDGGIVTRLDCVPFSIVVNKHAHRFYDEGEDVWPKRYAIWGRLVAAQPDQVGYVIIDAKSLNLFMPSVFPPIKADTLEELAGKMGLPADALVQTVTEFNNSCGDTSGFHPTELDGVSTSGLNPPKTNWARPINEPPFYGYSLRTGVTFTYLGLKVDERAQCSVGNRPVSNLWAAGETMAGSILGQGYLAGFGMTIGTVFGRIAGKEAADHANAN